MRNRNHKWKFIFIPFAAAAFVALTGFVVMNLWNYLLPAILHVGAITFWQAIGIFVLCKILFGFGRGKGHHMGGGAPWMRRRWEDRFRNMSAEDKEQFKAQMEKRCGSRWGRGAHRFNEGWDNFEPKTEKNCGVK